MHSCVMFTFVKNTFYRLLLFGPSCQNLIEIIQYYIGTETRNLLSLTDKRTGRLIDRRSAKRHLQTKNNAHKRYYIVKILKI